MQIYNEYRLIINEMLSVSNESKIQQNKLN